MLCEHLAALDRELSGAGLEVVYREQQVWSNNCRAWTRYACYLDLPSIRERLGLAACVVDHRNDDPRSGTERGFVCTEHHDAIMGDLEPRPGRPVVR